MNLLRTLAAISSMTMVSRITGLLRESLFAAAFGASNYTDAFNIAFRLPNLLRRLFAEGAFSQAFVPILTEYKTKHGQEATRTLVDHVATVLIWATMLTSIIGIIAAPVLILLIGGGLQREPEAFEASVFMTQLMFPYIVCMSFVALSSGVLNTWRQFKIPAFTPVLLNLSFIFAAVVMADWFAQPIYAMATGVCIGGLAQVALQVPSLKKLGMLPRLSLNPLTGLRDAGVRRMLSKMGPAVFSVAAAQISLLINTTIAAGLAAGAVTALQYADRLMELPTAAGMATLATPMIATLFHYGKFDSADVAASSMPLMAYSAGLLGFILVKTLAPAFFARQDVRTPVRIAVGVLVATQLMNLVFVPLFGVAGLALSIGAGACLNAAFLYNGLRTREIYVPHPGWGKFFFKLVVAVTVMGAVSWFGQAQFDWVGMRATPLLRAGALVAIISAAAAAYFGVLVALGFRPRDFRRRAG